MKKYDVSLLDSKGYTAKQNEIIANSPTEAYKIFIESNKPLPYRKIRLNWGVFGGETFDPPHYEGHTDVSDYEIKRQQELEAMVQQEAERNQILNLAKKIKEAGFNQLSLQEINTISTILDRSFLSDSLSEEDFKLIKSTLEDNEAYRFFTLRSNARSTLQQSAILEAMNVNLSSISDKSGGIKMASMVTGMVAARHLGEELAGEDESEDMDFGGSD